MVDPPLVQCYLSKSLLCQICFCLGLKLLWINSASAKLNVETSIVARIVCRKAKIKILGGDRVF